MLLFLDYDGVLHPDAVYRVPPWDALELRAEGELFMHAPILAGILDDHDPSGSEIQIVLSTSWVEALGYHPARQWLPEGLRNRVVGATSVPPYFTTRFNQIRRYVRDGVQPWLAIDDLHSATQAWPDEHRDKLILTVAERGLGCHLAQADLRTKLMEVLKNED